MTPSPEIEPGPHWWEASALTTAPSLLPQLLNGGVNVAIQPQSIVWQNQSEFNWF